MKQQQIQALEARLRREYKSLTGLVVRKNGLLQYAYSQNGASLEGAVHLYSVTKSILSALVGIAISKGLLEGACQKVLDFFPDYRAQPGEEGLKALTLRHLLTMTAPYKFSPEPYEAFFESENWVETALHLLGGEKPAGQFLYSPILGAHVLAGALEGAIGGSVLPFAEENLFSPLGISVSPAAVHSKEEQMAWSMQVKEGGSWLHDAQGVTTGSFGLALSAGDLAKIGDVYLFEGAFGSRQLVPAGWALESTRVQSRGGPLPYGYLWWIAKEGEGAFAALGDGGNALYVNRAKKLSVAVTSLMGPGPKDPLALISQEVVPLFEA